jgi:hypothetical protein
MNFELYQRVALNRDLNEYQLKKGDVATLIDFVPHPSNGEQGCVLEVFSATGKSIAVVIVPISDIKPLKNNEILSVRSIQMLTL